MINSITKIFDEFINETFKEKEQLRNFFLFHDRRILCINAICEQVKIAEMSNIGGVFDTKKYRLLIRTAAKMFCEISLQHKKEELLTPSEKARRIHDADIVKRAEEIMIDLEEEATTKKVVSMPGEVAR